MIESIVIFFRRKRKLSGYATTINCFDGAVQAPARKYMKRRYNVKYVDPIVEPGIVKILIGESDDPDAGVILRQIRKKLKMSIIDHKSRKISIAAHHNCLGNPASKEVQENQLRKAKKVIEKMIAEYELDIEIVLLWIDEHHMPKEVPELLGNLSFKETLYKTAK